MARKPERNVKLIRKVAKQIREKPSSYHQDSWFYDPTLVDEGESSDALSPERAAEIKRKGWVCGAVACVAGHALIASGRISEFTTRPYDSYLKERLLRVSWSEGGRKVLGLTPTEAGWLFSGSREEDLMPDLLTALAKGATLGDLMDMEDHYVEEHYV